MVTPDAPAWTWQTFTPARALPVLGGAAALGVLAHALVRGGGPLGVNFTLLVWAVLGTALLLTRRAPRSRAAVTLLGVAAAFAACVAWRDMLALTVLNVLATLLAGAVGLRYLRAPGQVWTMPPFAPLIAAALLWTHTLVQGAGLPARTNWRALAHPGRARAWGPLLRGALLALPLLLVFGALLGNADAAFGTLLGRLLRWNLGAFTRDALAWVVWVWALTGVLYVAALARTPTRPDPATMPIARLGATEVGIVLGSLAALFAAFMVVQGAYLFGGPAQVTALTGLTYAEYARRGFFELLTVTLLGVPLLLALRGALGADLRDHGWPRALTLLVTGLLAALLASAWTRMGLYVQVYGLSELRVLAGTAMVWVAALLGLLGWSVARARTETFTARAVLAGFVVLLGLNGLNPGLRIARDLGTRATILPAARAVQLTAQNLGADAAPYVLPNLMTLADGQSDVAAALRESVRGSAVKDWRSWNAARAHAGRLGAP